MPINSVVIGMVLNVIAFTIDGSIYFKGYIAESQQQKVVILIINKYFLLCLSLITKLAILKIRVKIKNTVTNKNVPKQRKSGLILFVNAPVKTLAQAEDIAHKNIMINPNLFSVVVLVSDSFT